MVEENEVVVSVKGTVVVTTDAVVVWGVVVLTVSGTVVVKDVV